MSLITINNTEHSSDETPFNGKLRTFIIDGKRYLNGDDVCNILKFKKSRNAIKNHLNNEDIFKLEEILRDGGALYRASYTPNELRALYITEPSVYILAAKSPDKHLISHFIKWYCANYTQIHQPPPELPPVNNNILDHKNENQLHKDVVAFFRREYPDFDRYMIAGLGENQTTSEIRIESHRKGYTGGQPDLMFTLGSGKYKGLAIEIKTPTGKGVLSEKQRIFLLDLKLAGYKVLLSHNYEEIITTIHDYFKNANFQCLKCKKGFKSQVALTNHSIYVHRIDPATDEKTKPAPSGVDFSGTNKYFFKGEQLCSIKRVYNKRYYYKFVEVKSKTVEELDSENFIIKISFNIDNEMTGGYWIEKSEVCELLEKEECECYFLINRTIDCYKYIIIEKVF